MNPLHDVVRSLANRTGVTLPDSYFAFLDRLETNPAISTEPLIFGGKPWRTHTASSLLKPFRLNRGDPVVQAHETAAHAMFLRETADPVLIAGLSEHGFDLDRLARGFCVGSSVDDDPIFVDSDTHAVFVYRHEAMDVERWANDLDTFISHSRG